MSLALAVRKAALAPGKWVSFPSALWRRAKAAPSLDLRFADNKSLVDAVTGQNLVTFTRASSGTYVGSDGLIKTATTNLLLQSEDFSTTWTTGSASVSTNTATAPNGTSTADTFIPNSGVTISGNGNFHGLRQLLTVSNATTYTLSCYVKPAGYSVLRFGLSSQINLVNNYSDITVNLATLSVTQTLGTGTVTPVGNGWFRVTATGSTTGATAYAVFVTADGGTANGTSGIYLWGAQLEQSSTVGEYTPTTSTINSAPRFDHNPTTGESLGLLVEEQRTNLLLQSNGFETTWVNSNSSETATAGIAPDGTNTAWELRDTSDASATGHSLAQSVPFTSGNAYTFTVWMKAGTLNEGGIAVPSSAFGATLINRVNLTTGAVISTTAGSTTIVTQFANGWYRVSLTATATATASGNSQIRPMNGGTTYIGTGTGTILIWGAQLEAGAFPTSYIPTTTATVTRSADVASISGSNFSSWYRQDEGTVFAGFRHYSLAAVAGVTSTDDSTFSNRIQLRVNTLGAAASIVSSGGSIQANYSTSNTSQALQPYSAATSYKADDFSLCLNGGAISTDSAGSIPTVNQLVIGNNVGANPLNGTIRGLTYWPQRLSNSTLQAVTQ